MSEVQLDHMILPINELSASTRFYRDTLGFLEDGPQGPFHGIRVSDSFLILLSPYGTSGGLHLAFNLVPERFDNVFQQIKQAGVPFGDRFDATGNGLGPTPQPGATGDVPGIYVLDPDKHLIELRRTG